MAAATIRMSALDAQHVSNNLRKLAKILRTETQDDAREQALGAEVARLFGLGIAAREPEAKFCEELASAIKVAARVIENA